VTVASHGNKVPKDGLKNGDMSGADSGTRMGTDDIAEQKHGPAVNASETLPALLYVPRNGKHVKINGNLVIKSVVASEKASSRIPRSDGKSSVNQGNGETGLAIPRHVSKLGSVEVVESAKRITNKLIALPPGDGSSIYREDDELLPQWFSEAMSGKNATKKKLHTPVDILKEKCFCLCNKVASMLVSDTVTFSGVKMNIAIPSCYTNC
jgi:hypothetical protein